MLDSTSRGQATMAHLGLMTNDMFSVSEKTTIQYRQKRRDFKNALLVSVALRIQHEQGIRAAGKFLISWNVPIWVSARVLFDPCHIRQSDRLN